MQPSRVLLVDDEPSIRVVLGAVLQNSGFEVTTAEDGFAALREIRRTAPQLIVTDLRMPNMSGFELLAVVREQFPAIPAIAISGEFVGERVRGILADVFFQKGSYSPSELVTAARHLIANGPGERAAHGDIWASLKGSSAMVTCAKCFKSFPLEPCDSEEASPHTTCIFCGAELEYRLLAVTRAAK